MGYKTTDDTTHGCLSGLSGAASREIDFTEGNTSYTNTDYNPEASHAIMDMMERDLGVVFTERERNGFTNVGYNHCDTRRQMHMSILPHRWYMESCPNQDQTDNLDLLFLRNIEHQWGAFMACHMVTFYGQSMMYNCRGDQAWFLYMYRHVRDSDDAYKFSAKDAVVRTAALFPIFDDAMGNHNLTESGRSYNMSLNGATLDDPKLVEICDWLDAEAEVRFSEAQYCYSYDEPDSHRFTDEAEFVVAAKLLQEMFVKVQKLALQRAADLPVVEQAEFTPLLTAVRKDAQPVPVSEVA